MIFSPKKKYQKDCGTVDRKNPAPIDMVKYPIIYKVLYTSEVVVWDLSHQQYQYNIEFTQG